MLPLNRISRIVEALVFSLIFRVRHRLFRGRIRSDNLSISKCAFGKGLAIRGSLSFSDGGLVMGDKCSLAKFAEVGADEKGAIDISDSVSIGPRSIISTSGGQISIGSKTSFFSDCIISGDVDIGQDCLFANNVTVLSGSHRLVGGGTIRENDAAFSKAPGYKRYERISIGDDCWLGANSVVLAGVALGRGTVVGANAVVTKSFPAYSIVAGVPAKIIGSRLTADGVLA